MGACLHVKSDVLRVSVAEQTEGSLDVCCLQMHAVLSPHSSCLSQA